MTPEISCPSLAPLIHPGSDLFLHRDTYDHDSSGVYRYMYGLNSCGGAPQTEKPGRQDG